MTHHLYGIFFVFISSMFLGVQAQNITFPIDQHNGQNIETCSGFFTDSGGDTLTPYSNNEAYNVTFTAPQDTEEPQYIKFEFAYFALGEGDTLYVYDGTDAGAELLATGTGTNLLDQTLWSTGASIHFSFVSSEADTATGWWANISCFELCEAFYVDVNTNSGSFDFCPDVQSVSFTANAGYYGGSPEGEGENTGYLWNFGGDTFQGEAVTQNYEGPGAYPFHLQVTDPDNTCLLDTLFTVRIATIPTFEGTMLSADTVCAGESFSLMGNANATTWTGFPTRVDTTAFITEGQPFVSTLTFDVFPEEQEIVFTEDFDRVCVDIEHVDFGHLTFSLECPNGTSVLFKDQSIGGAHLGEPVVFNDFIPGIGYEYCFSTQPQLGPMEETAFQFHNYTDQAGDVYFNQPYLPEGNYTPAESFQAFIGCPLNGEWTLTVEDLVTGTSGHVTGWSMFFNEDFYPDSLIFTPQIVEEGWYDQNGNQLGDNPVSHSIDTEGEHELTFRIRDDFNCLWDTTLVVFVHPLPKGEIVSEFEIPICEGDSTLLTVVPEFAGDEMNWLYQWMLEGADLEGRTSDTLMAKLPTNYMVRVTDTITSCFDFFELNVSEQNCDLRIPNVFTPNGDGINDVFEIENLEHYPNSVIVIYNRNGKKVFEHTDYYLNWWDGGNQAQGTYYYIITYTRQEKEKQAHGVITIVR
ncbi:MAG: gliding motility-associated C-terminal domain-containing protein [Bacteroidota bacterium]